MAKTKQHLSTSENSVLPKTALTLSEPLMNIMANSETKNAVWLTTGTMGSGSCSTLRVKK